MRNKEIEEIITDILFKANQIKIINLKDKDIDIVNKKINEIRELATALEEAVKHINKKMPKGEIWQPKENENYYYIQNDNCVEYDSNDATVTDNDRINCGNCYQTEEKAKFEAQREKFTRLFRQYVEQHTEPMKHLYIKLERFYAYWDIESQTIEIANHKGYIDSFQIYANRKEILEDAINFIGEENFKKYILEIKE